MCGCPKYVTAAGGIWTVSRDGGNRINKLTDPYNRRTTLAYDRSNKLKRVTDVSGRISTFSVDGSGILLTAAMQNYARHELGAKPVAATRVFRLPNGR